MVHYKKFSLEPSKVRDTRPTRFCVFDIESFGLDGDAYAIGFYDGKKFYSFEGFNKSEAWLNFTKFYFQKKHRNMICFAHNGGHFDFHRLIKANIETGVNDRIKIKNIILFSSRIGELVFSDVNRNTWKFRDSVCYFPTSLKKVLKAYGCDTQKGDFDHEGINKRNWKQQRKDWLPYLEKDCKGLYEVVEKFQKGLLKEYSVNLSKNVTVAQTAMNIFRKNFLKIDIPTYQYIEDEVRQSYFGGRVEVFKHYAEDLNYYDVNSLYPYVMETNMLPVGKPIRNRRMDVDHFGICHAKVNVPTWLNIPVLPYRVKEKGANKLFFPVGKFEGWYTTPELKVALEKGCTIEVTDGYEFEPYPLFKNVMSKMYKIKAEATDPVKKNLAKLLMNSTYGKFGQRRDRKETVVNAIDIIGLEQLSEDLGIYQRTVHSDACHILPAIASFVTSYARLHLHSLLDGNEPIYCDTDSVITNKVMDTGKGLGELKLEKQIKKRYFLSPKNYYDGEDIKLKGFRHDWVKEHLSEDSYIKAIGGDFSDFNMVENSLIRFKESMRRDIPLCSMVQKTKCIKSRYDKRIMYGEYSFPVVVENGVINRDISSFVDVNKF